MYHRSYLLSSLEYRLIVPLNDTAKKPIGHIARYHTTLRGIAARYRTTLPAFAFRPIPVPLEVHH